jgi:hypothetical protein
MPWSTPLILQAGVVVQMSETAAGCKDKDKDSEAALGPWHLAFGHARALPLLMRRSSPKRAVATDGLTPRC